MTAATMDLRELLDQTTDTDLLCEMIGFIAQQLRDPERRTDGRCSVDRLTHRNGYRVPGNRAGTTGIDLPWSNRRSVYVRLWSDLLPSLGMASILIKSADDWQVQQAWLIAPAIGNQSTA